MGSEPFEGVDTVQADLKADPFSGPDIVHLMLFFYHGGEEDREMDRDDISYQIQARSGLIDTPIGLSEPTPD